MTTQDALRTRACAKVNLTLEVLGKRADGFHELHTLFDELEFGEELVFHPLPGTGAFEMELENASDDVPRGGSNLVLRAAALAREQWRLDFSGRFELRKELPSGAGLGGGSADAAAALRLVARAAGRDLDSPGVRTELEALGRQLGADVAFFVRGGRAFARGRGDEPEAVPRSPRLHYVLLLPDIVVETAAVFSRWHGDLAAEHRLNEGPERLGCAEKDRRAVRAMLRDPQRLTVDLSRLRAPSGLLGGLFNDLAPAAMLAYPALAELRSAIHREGFTDLQLSGSGSTFFLASLEREVAESAARDLEALVLRLRDEGGRGLGPKPRVIRTESRNS